MEANETTGSLAENAPTRKWQFSLREIIIATAAIAAIIAIVMQNRPRKVSIMAQQFNPSAILTQVITDKGLQGKVIRRGGGGRGGSQSSLNFVSMIQLRDVSDSDVTEILMPALLDEIRTAIIDEGYSITKQSKAGAMDEVTEEWKSISNFGFGYRGSRIFGQLRVFTCYDSEGVSRLIITLDEN